ncbi:Asp/Glu racemase [Verticiella sediminum]|uniref:Asp/Glu racemase n=1 Tax=Verticiella sediminum TaxID=1247510 RepID=A0A556B1V3_9BURK|nr:aspartate/glutamate racemase family protein [Verticiella sediminum]TSH99161.1 Asp/Glu racemase [Verticiella sediminum]
MRALLINPNTTPAITAKVLAAAQAFAPDIAFTAATGRFGAAYIASRAAYAVASHAALDAWAAQHAGQDAIILACFGDPGLDALRELSDVPVVGMAEAAVHAAMQAAPRFSIVTGGAAWKPMLQDYLAARGLAHGIASIRTVEPTGATLVNAAQESVALLHETCLACIERDGAEAIVIGGAGLVAFSAPLRRMLPVPLIDGLEAAIATAGTATRLGIRAAPLRCAAADSTGLSDALAAALRCRPHH